MLNLEVIGWLSLENKCGMNMQGGDPAYLALIPSKFADISCQEFSE